LQQQWERAWPQCGMKCFKAMVRDEYTVGNPPTPATYIQKNLRFGMIDLNAEPRTQNGLGATHIPAARLVLATH